MCLFHLEEQKQATGALITDLGAHKRLQNEQTQEIFPVISLKTSKARQAKKKKWNLNNSRWGEGVLGEPGSA